MIQYTERYDDGLTEIKRIVWKIVAKGRFPTSSGDGGSLIVFGVSQGRADDVYISPRMPDVNGRLYDLKKFLKKKGYTIRVSEVGNSYKYNNWVGFRRKMRLSAPEDCAKIVVIVSLIAQGLIKEEV